MTTTNAEGRLKALEDAQEIERMLACLDRLVPYVAHARGFGERETAELRAELLHELFPPPGVTLDTHKRRLAMNTPPRSDDDLARGHAVWDQMLEWEDDT